MTQGAWLSVVAVLVVLLAPPVLAQSTGSIGGTVRDTTGAVLPGVTIEAACGWRIASQPRNPVSVSSFVIV